MKRSEQHANIVNQNLNLQKKVNVYNWATDLQKCRLLEVANNFIHIELVTDLFSLSLPHTNTHTFHIVYVISLT